MKIYQVKLRCVSCSSYLKFYNHRISTKCDMCGGSILEIVEINREPVD